MVHLLQLTIPTPIFARGGGGGSGGGGGGGGSGGGGGGGIFGIALIGYLPAHFVTARCATKLPRLVAITLGSLAGLIVSILMGLANVGLGLLVFIGAIIGVYSGMHDWLSRLAGKRTKEAIAVAATKDPAWQQAGLEQRVRQAFGMYQEDWSALKTDRLTTYATPEYSRHAYYMMLALHQMGRRNLMSSWTITDITLTSAVDAQDDTNDRFTACISAGADDRLIDATTQKVLYRDTSSFQEFWNFKRSGNAWLVDSIDQATADMGMASLGMQQFASKYNMFYSLDWGVLLLPTRGQLFNKGSFKNSDINNHVIGDWQGLLVQLYTYIPNKQSNTKVYLIGQINLPKPYGGILIKRRARWDMFSRPPRGYRAVSFEWPDFNRRYRVYATDMEKVTAFELLNPKTMADLYDADLPINIEVVDNIVYFYCPMKMSTTGYDKMIKVLQMAHKELKR